MVYLRKTLTAEIKSAQIKVQLFTELVTSYSRSRYSFKSDGFNATCDFMKGCGREQHFNSLVYLPPSEYMIC